jgi:hypothetical protein
MWNPRSLLAAALVVIAVASIDGGQGGLAPRSIRLEFPEAIDLTGLSIQYFMTGSFGGVGSYVRTEPNRRVYSVEAWQAGQAARTLKAIVYCPGRRIALVSESGFGDGPPKILQVRLEPLGIVPVVGRVIGAGYPRPLRVEVMYVASWSHGFFGIVDGAVASFRVASTELKPDGSFAVTVPDLASDPVVASYRAADRGSLAFVAREPETGNIAFFLHRKKGPSSRVDVPIARAYPGELEFGAAK